MPFTLTMPKLSPTMEAGNIVKWHVKEGDEIKEEDVLFEVATDKATVEYNAIDPGFLRKILIAEGGDAVVNQPVAIFTETKDESIEGYEPEGIAPAEQPAEQKVEAKEEGEKAPSPIPQAAAAGAMTQPAFEPAPPLVHYEYEWPSDGGRLKASPLAKKMAREESLDLSGVKGSGPDGRVMSRDVKMAPKKAPVNFGYHKAPSIAPGTYEEEVMSPMRKAIGNRLQASKTFIPHFYVQQEVNAEPIVRLREELKSFGIKITFNDLVTRACAIALKEFPQINSGYNSVTSSIIRFKTVDIAIAVTIEGGLITPIIRHADAKNVTQLSAEVRHLADLAKKGKLTPEQYLGGSFTISNLGMFGIKDFQAVINPPQAAILAVGGIHDRPVIKEGRVVPGKVMELSLSSDHRVIDGAEAAQFITTIQKYLENPSVLLV